jgi:hypothetical protein
MVMSHLRLPLVILFPLLFLAGEVSALSIDGGSYQVIITADKDMSKKTADTYLFMHEARLFINGSPNSSLEIKNEIKSSWLPDLKGSPTSDVSLFDLIAWKTVLYFKTSSQFQIGFGNVFVNYSPYVFHAEEWQDAFFKGVFGQINEEKFSLHVFLGFHSESQKTNVVLMAPGIKNLGFFYNQRNFHNTVVQQPTLWGGFNASYDVSDRLALKLIAGHESYSITSEPGDYFFYANEIIQPEILWSPVSWFGCHLSVSGYFQSYQAYYGMWDYFGPGKHFMVLDYTSRNFYPAGEGSIDLRNPLFKVPALATTARILYRYIDKNYQPVHMDNGAWDENRGEDFMDFLAVDRKGWIFSLSQPLFKVLAIGGEARFFKSIDDKISQEDYRANIRCESLFQFLNLSLILRSQSLTGAAFKDGSGNLLSAYLKAGIKDIGKWEGQAIVSLNDRDKKDIDQIQLIAKFYF